jgi:TusA-related sulfurtransferase
MQRETVDLTKERCPMSLLLAKRASAKLNSSQSLRILVSDHSSLSDMQAYFQRQKIDVQVRLEADHYQLIITKE